MGMVITIHQIFDVYGPKDKKKILPLQNILIRKRSCHKNNVSQNTM